MPVDPRLAQLDELPEQDTPETPEVETEAPNEDTPAPPAVDYEQRYTNLRPEFDRTKQQLAEERQIREQYEAELERLRTGAQPGRDVHDEYDEDDLADPVARRYIAELQAQVAAQAQKDAERERQDTLEAQREQEYTYIDDELTSLEQQLNEKFDDDEADWIGNYAGRNRDEHGRPDVRLAYQKYSQMLERRKARWVETKPSAKPATGPGAVEVPDLDDPDAREEYLDRAFRGE